MANNGGTYIVTESGEKMTAKEYHAAKKKQRSEQKKSIKNGEK